MPGAIIAGKTNTSNFARGCADPDCFFLKKDQVFLAQPASIGQSLTVATGLHNLVTVDNLSHPLFAEGHTSRATALRILMQYTPPFNALCGQQAQRIGGWIWYTNRVGNVEINVSNGLVAFAGADGNSIVVNMTFDEPLDVVWSPMSFNHLSGRTERLQAITPWPEFYPGVGSILARANNVPANTTYSDGNSGPSRIKFRRVMPGVVLSARGFPNTGFFCGFNLQVEYGTLGYELAPCRKATVFPGACPIGQDASAVRHCAVNPAVPSWFPAFPPNGGVWEFSADGGANWSLAAANVAHAGAQAAELYRWRVPFTIPPGFEGHWRIWVEGDKSDNAAPASYGRFYLDGNLIDGNTEINALRHWSPYISAAPGAHVLEWREGAYTVAGNTAPLFGADYTNVDPETVPLNLIQCLSEGMVASEFYWPDAPPVGYTINQWDCADV